MMDVKKWLERKHIRDTIIQPKIVRTVKVKAMPDEWLKWAKELGLK